jgi:hypothetical protein
VPKYQFSPERCCEAIEASDLGRAGVAHQLDCSESLIDFYCLGYRQPPPPRLVALAQLLDCAVEDFFVQVDDDSPSVPVYPPSDWRKRYPHRSAKAAR